jgi:uncharacterized protein
MLGTAGTAYTDGDVDTNRSGNENLEALVEARYSRRQALINAFSATSAAVFVPVMLTGCDDDGDGGAAPAGLQASASASVSSGAVTTLMGGAANGGTFTSFQWSQTSGPGVDLQDANTQTARFIAPSVSVAAPATFTLTGTNANGRTATATVSTMIEPAKLGFSAVAKGLGDTVVVPAGYVVTVLYRLGDPTNAATSAYANNGTDTSFANRAGDHHDGMYYFGLAASGSAPDPNNSSRGLLCINHENITQRYLHPNGASPAPRPAAEVLKEIEAHGISVIEVVRSASGQWSYVQNSPLNRRINPLTPMQINGPARGNAQMRTLFSPDGTQGRGTINNCANGFTPWGTYLTCEENWAGYFRRDAADAALRTPKQNTSFARYGRGLSAVPPATSLGGNYAWTTATPVDAGDTRFSKFNITVNPAAPADGTGDFRNEINQFGWTVEIDPYNPTSTPRKRTAMGRMAKEGAWPGRFISGVRPAWYQGDDAAGDYLYKFVSAAPWAPADATAPDRLATGDKYLDNGTLYVAKFNADGSGQWLPLVFGQGNLTAANAAYPFADQADVLINARLAGDAVGATRMDRPEWTAVNPATGEMYLTLTNGPTRNGTTLPTDAANPRVYVDPPSTTRSNRNGHIIRLRETGDSTEATTFRWDIYLFAAGSDLDATNINLSGLDATNDLSSPDGLWFSRPQNAGGLVSPLLWIQTDDGAFTDVTNCMMLVGQPGSVGDGGTRTITNTIAGGATQTQATIVGAAPGVKLKRFLVGPKECEITGIDSTPDGKTLFVNIQHPGEDTTTGFPNSFPSNWPASQTDAAAVSRPRSSTIVITRTDGGVVGLS